MDPLTWKDFFPCILLEFYFAIGRFIYVKKYEKLRDPERWRKGKTRKKNYLVSTNITDIYFHQKNSSNWFAWDMVSIINAALLR